MEERLKGREVVLDRMQLWRTEGAYDTWEMVGEIS
jgi:hypothetical protein